jgi:hypothetical protein
VLIKDTNKSPFYVTAHHQDTIAVLKAKIQVKTNIAVDKQRLIYAGKTQNDDNTLSVFNIREGDVLHLALELVGGMPKKGCKKTICKAERIATTRAKAQYAHSLVYDVNLAAMVSTIGQGPFSSNSTSASQDADALRHVKLVAENATRVDRIPKAILPLLEPRLVELKAQRDAIDRALRAADDAVELGFLEQYTTDDGLQDLDPFFDALDTRIAELDRVRIENEVLRNMGGGFQQPGADAPM